MDALLSTQKENQSVDYQALEPHLRGTGITQESLRSAYDTDPTIRSTDQWYELMAAQTAQALADPHGRTDAVDFRTLGGDNDGILSAQIKTGGPDGNSSLHYKYSPNSGAEPTIFSVGRGEPDSRGNRAIHLSYPEKRVFGSGHHDRFVRDKLGFDPQRGRVYTKNSIGIGPDDAQILQRIYDLPHHPLRLQ